MNKKGNVLAVLMLLFMGVLAVSVVLLITGVIELPTTTVSTATSTQTAQQVATATKTGDIASLGVYVRDLANDDINTKLAVATYCQDDKGEFIIDGTTSSTTAEITGKTEIGRTVTCWAFSSTIQSDPKTIKIDGESPHIVIDAYTITGDGNLQFYTDTFTTGTGVTNVTIASAGQSDTLQKMKYTNNVSDKFLPLGGFYFATASGSNVSGVDISGSATLGGMDHASTQIVSSVLTSRVATRKDNFDFVFEVDDDSTKAGNQVLLMDEQDYLESGTVVIEASSTACNPQAGVGDLVSSFAFTKGYYRSSIENSVKYGHETDATTASLVSANDVIGATFYCNSD
ncbi:MAG: hypothetical protein KKF56_05275 [Nanoarchaeota archaeon]|nr:hypothetical protein [Nanoarchaeota archaeon]